MSLYLSEESVFENRVSLNELPQDTDLHVVTDAGSFPVSRKGSGDAAIVSARIRSNISTVLTDRALFDETVAYLGRSMNKLNIRTIAIESDAPGLLLSAPTLDVETKVPLVDRLEPSQLAQAFRPIRGQTALIIGRVENGKIFFEASNGTDVSRDIDEFVRAARQNDVSLVILQTDTTRQPGGRNWLWQRIEVDGLNDAARTATFGDFLDVLAAKRGGFDLTASRETSGRIQIVANPSDAASGISNQASTALAETLSHFTGEVIAKAVDIHGRDQSAETESDAEIIPGIPSYIQIPYAISFLAGLMSLPMLRRWWERVWPQHVADAGAGRGIKIVTGLPRQLAFILAFIPVAGLPALIWQSALQTWATALAPFKWIYRRFLRREV
jgi:hypothetical protein